MAFFLCTFLVIFGICCSVQLFTRFNNPNKGAVTHAIVHRILWEYLVAINALPDASEQEKLRREVFERYILSDGTYHLYWSLGQLSRALGRNGTHKRWEPCCARVHRPRNGQGLHFMEAIKSTHQLIPRTENKSSKSSTLISNECA